MSIRTAAAVSILSLPLALGCGGEEVVGPPANNAGSVSLASDRDNTLYEDAGGQQSNGAGEFLFTGITNQPGLRRALIHFEVAGASIPAGSTIDSVTLTLNMSRTNTGATTVGLHSLTADWGEGTSVALGAQGVGIVPTTGDATWLDRFFDTAQWTTPGGDFASTASASTVVENLGLYTWGSTAAMMADVVGWLADPATNFGWAVIGDETNPGTAKRFDARETSTAQDRPTLTIYFTRP